MGRRQHVVADASLDDGIGDEVVTRAICDDDAVLLAQAFLCNDAHETNARVEGDAFARLEDGIDVLFDAMTLQQALEVPGEVAHRFYGECFLIADGGRESASEGEPLHAHAPVLATLDELHKRACSRLVDPGVVHVATHEVEALEVHVRAPPRDVDGTVYVADGDAVLIALGGPGADLQHRVHADHGIDVLFQLFRRLRNVFQVFDAVCRDGLDAHLHRKVQVLLVLKQVREHELFRLEVGQQSQDQLSDRGTVQVKPLLAGNPEDLQVTGAFHRVLQRGVREDFLKPAQPRADLALHHHIERRAVLLHDSVHGSAFYHHHAVLVLRQKSRPPFPHITTGDVFGRGSFCLFSGPRGAWIHLSYLQKNIKGANYMSERGDVKEIFWFER